MTTLTRIPGEVITIGDDITVEVIYIKGDRVSLRIEVPEGMQVHREEVYNQINGVDEDGSKKDRA